MNRSSWAPTISSTGHIHAGKGDFSHNSKAPGARVNDARCYITRTCPLLAPPFVSVSMLHGAAEMRFVLSDYVDAKRHFIHEDR
jgi:hypothetical protein